MKKRYNQRAVTIWLSLVEYEGLEATAKEEKVSVTHQATRILRTALTVSPPSFEDEILNSLNKIRSKLHHLHEGLCHGFEKVLDPERAEFTNPRERRNWILKNVGRKD
jgi:hypothetical protein